jgi:ubiquinol-cytochrome c reductase cytochrome c1 subunit
MVRNLAMLVGAAFVAALAWALFGTVSGWITDPPAATAAEEFHLAPREPGFSFNGPFGTFDQRQLQRGLQVYKEVCSNCHSLSHVAFRDLTGIGYSDAQAKKFEEGPEYVYSLLTGYKNQAGFRNARGEGILKAFPDAKTPDGLYFNPYFANLNIAMPPPLTKDGQVGYLDGTRSTVDQNARDVAAFLTWAAEPKLEVRHTAGLVTVIFLLIFCLLAWGAYRNVWADVEH